MSGGVHCPAGGATAFLSSANLSGGLQAIPANNVGANVKWGTFWTSDASVFSTSPNGANGDTLLILHKTGGYVGQLWGTFQRVDSAVTNYPKGLWLEADQEPQPGALIEPKLHPFNTMTRVLGALQPAPNGHYYTSPFSGLDAGVGDVRVCQVDASSSVGFFLAAAIQGDTVTRTLTAYLSVVYIPSLAMKQSY